VWRRLSEIFIRLIKQIKKFIRDKAADGVRSYGDDWGRLRLAILSAHLYQTADGDHSPLGMVRIEGFEQCRDLMLLRAWEPGCGCK
jgi:hypothetical protein